MFKPSYQYSCCYQNKTDLSKPDMGTGTKGTKARGKRPFYVDEFDRAVIRRIVHEYFGRNEPPTLTNLLATVKERLTEGNTTTFPYGRKVLWKIMRQIGFRYGKRRGPNPHMLYERADIAEWRVRYLRDIQMYREQNRSIVYLDETWFTSNDAYVYQWQDDKLQQNPRLMRQDCRFTHGLRQGSGRGQRLIIVNAIEREGLINGTCGCSVPGVQ